MTDHRLRPAALRAAALDGLLVLGLPLALVGVYALPTAARRGLTLHYLAPTPLSVYAAHLVHFRLAHLGANLVGALLAAGLAYLLAAAAGERRRLRAAVGGLLVALPVALSLLNLAWPRGRVGYGASGLVMGLVGLVPVFAFVYLDGVAGVRASVADAPVLFLPGLAVAGVAAPLGRLGAWVGVAAALATLCYARGLSLPVARLRALPAGHPELLAAAAVVAVGYPAVAFPADPRVAGGVLDLFSHLLGYALGFLSAYLTPGVGVGVAALWPGSGSEPTSGPESEPRTGA